MSTGIKKTTRYLAMELLTRVATQQAYSNLLVNKTISSNQLSQKDGALLTEIVYGTLSRRLTLDYYLSPFLKKNQKLDPWVRELLRLSVYQLEFLERVPAHAVVDEAVKIGKARGNQGIGKFVNGVLRSLQRSGVPALDEISETETRLSVELSMPKWLVAKLIEQIGVEETRKLGLSLFEPSHVSVRVNTDVTNVAAAQAELTAEGFELSPSPLSAVGLIGKKGFLAGSQLFKNGGITLQDESSMLVAPSLQIEPHHLVLDACAAPGGKTSHIATYLDPAQGGKVIALDIHQHKVELIGENAARLGVADRVEPMLLDARKVDEVFPDRHFDRILADVPCSGLGLLRRKPDIKYSKKPEDFVNLPVIQQKILASLAPKVKQYGIITYSTCTMSPSENEAVIQAFLAEHPDFELIDVANSEKLQESPTKKWVTLYPHHYQTDGFFICCLRRVA